MIRVSTTNPELEKFAEHYEAVVNRYLEEHPEVMAEITKQAFIKAADVLREYWGT